MKRKRHTSEQIVEKLRKADELLASGKNNEEAAKCLSVTVTTLYRWKRQFGDIGNREVRRLRELEKENARLKKLLVERDLDNLVLKEVIEGKL